MEKLLYRVEEAAVILSIGRTRVFGLINSGELRSVRIGGSRRVPRAALAEFLRSLESEQAEAA
ncbi:excisionase family DNA binding protein [Actinoalloteichus hoggarensis]|uniref:Helix-turn-helix domain protein n=1 Tax=Actinoalloteichus hoggarensis TaxID=1470176 RepID=A0A221VWM5_9PSEU|nr:helix-turn-helix domain-containing protein [Actinoalloteichus hoggarensis]ASO17950.1 Helix-turn-helix domain protein [Actinoalloteichus hoggarensis]MBB5924362.1 excisionase family DNA binding protein [Actinoalloteichus hoggarensis]